MTETTSIRSSRAILPSRLLEAYEAVVEHGIIRAPVSVPDGSQVFIIVPPLPARPRPESEEWRRPFEEFESYVRGHPAPASMEELSDEELNVLIHEVRARPDAGESRG